ncbi:hypothetical protein [Shewanella hanedai]|uniref:Uncharacterized protein n=1 Tax=Shewanella hanedai TaxID=25 RepID=A0A553JM40_SHEHA|nr:hypothetical protein [Shewanella hanedai]TRY13535.1 hypothetical protein FN961_14940 [Shewanella hanedai]
MEQLKLLIIILIPFVPFLLWVLKTLSNNSEKQTNKKKVILKSLSLNPNTGLHEQPLFWFSLVIPFVGFLSTGFFAWHDYTLSVNSDGFNIFLNISKLPLAVWGLCLPLAVLIARLHGTIQTAAQIEISTETAKRDKLKLNQEQFKNAKALFVELMTKHWEKTIATMAPEFRELKFNPDSYFHSVFSTSSANKGLKPCSEIFNKNLEEIAEQFISFMNESGWEKNAGFVKLHLARLDIYVGDKLKDDDLTTKDKMFHNYIAIYTKAIPNIVERVESEFVESS